MTLRRGEVLEVTGQRRRSVLVVSHGMYNDQSGIPTVLTMRWLAGATSAATRAQTEKAAAELGRAAGQTTRGDATSF